MPERYRNCVIPHIFVADASAAISHYGDAFGATELFRVTSPDGEIVHAELEIDGSVLMIGDPDGSGLFVAADAERGSSVGLHIYVTDVDALAKRAAQAGLQIVSEPQDMFYGDRMAMLKDRFGMTWVLLQQIEEDPPEEIKRRGELLLGSAQP